MTAITAFPAIPSGLFGGTYISFTAKAEVAVKTGQLLIQDLHAANTVSPAPASGLFNKKWPVGVAMGPAAAGELVTVITTGVVYMANDTSTSAIAAGVLVKAGTFAGAIAAATIAAATGYAATDTIIGVALDSIAVSSYGRVLLQLSNS
jgi:hypothetical protein